MHGGTREPEDISKVMFLPRYLFLEYVFARFMKTIPAHEWFDEEDLNYLSRFVTSHELTNIG